MTHPGTLLLDYVDGTLDDATRARIDAHLRSCAACREEVRLSTTARRAAGSLPMPRAPEGLADPALAEADRVARERHPEVASVRSGDRRRPDAPRWVGLATAAAVVVAIALIAPNLGNDRGGVTEHAASAPDAASQASASPAPREAVVVQDKDYSPEDLTDATRSARQALGTSTSENAAAAAPAADAGAVFAGTTSRTLTFTDAARCLDRAFESSEGKIVRLVRAKYNGTPAYLGVYLVGADGDVPAELRIDVASVGDCRILAQSSARL